MDRIPYEEGKPPPSEGYVLARIMGNGGADEGLWWIPAANLKSSPPRHEDVDDLVPMIRWTWRHLSPHVTWCRSFEDWELQFLRDQNPENEVALWVQGTYAFLEFVHRNPDVDPKAVFAAVSQLLVGRTDLIKPESVARGFWDLQTIHRKNCQTQTISRLMGRSMQACDTFGRSTPVARHKQNALEHRWGPRWHHCEERTASLKLHGPDGTLMQHGLQLNARLQWTHTARIAAIRQLLTMTLTECSSASDAAPCVC